MGESWLTEFFSNRWTQVICAYLIGLLTGLVLPDSDAAGDDEIIYDIDGEDYDEDPPTITYEADAPPSMKLGALEAEIKHAKKLLSESAEEQRALSDIIGSVDDAVKRANGRLKVILKSINRIKNGG